MHRLAIGELSGQTALPRANPRREVRLSIGMRVLAVVGCLFGLWASPGCFELNYPSCRIRCNVGESCPRGLQCVSSATSTDHFCNVTADICDSPVPGTDASVPNKDASAGGPPQEICHRGSCLTLPDAIRSNLVLLLWPSNLPALGSPVSVWPDLSGKGNDAKPANPDASPTVTEDGVKLAPDRPGAGFVVANSSSLDLAAEDFSMLVVSGLETGMPATFFSKSDQNRADPRQVVLQWVFTGDGMAQRPRAIINATTVDAQEDIPLPSVNVYTLRRTGGRMELRVNSVVLGSADLRNPVESTSNAEDLFLGVVSAQGRPVGSLQATFAVKGSLSGTDLATLERFLHSTFQPTP